MGPRAWVRRGVMSSENHAFWSQRRSREVRPAGSSSARGAESRELTPKLFCSTLGHWRVWGRESGGGAARTAHGQLTGHSRVKQS